MNAARVAAKLSHDAREHGYFVAGWVLAIALLVPAVLRLVIVETDLVPLLLQETALNVCDVMGRLVFLSNVVFGFAAFQRERRRHDAGNMLWAFRLDWPGGPSFYSAFLALLLNGAGMLLLKAQILGLV